MAFRNQINEATGSCMDSIAEGFERFNNKEFSQFLIISKGSNGEVQSKLYRAFDRKHISEETFNLRLEFSKTISRKLKALIDYLRKTPIKQKPVCKTASWERGKIVKNRKYKE